MDVKCKVKFYWQTSCSAFSVSKNDIERVCKYIINQPIHHKKQTFAEENEQFMKFYQQTLLPKKSGFCYIQKLPLFFQH